MKHYKPNTRGARTLPEKESPADTIPTTLSVPLPTQDHSVDDSASQRMAAGAGDANSVETSVPGPTCSAGQSPVSDRRPPTLRLVERL